MESTMNKTAYRKRLNEVSARGGLKVMSVRIGSVLATFAFIMLTSNQRSHGSGPGEIKNNGENLRIANVQDAIDRNVSERQLIVHYLVDKLLGLKSRRAIILPADTYGQEVIAAITALGKLQAYDEADVLCTYLHVQNRSKVFGPLPTVYSDYPAVGALSDMGLSILPRVFDYFERNGSNSDLPLVSAIIFRILGKDVGSAYIKEVLFATRDDHSKDMVQRLLTYYDGRTIGQLGLGK